jgi:hypothetical protein
MGGGVIMTEIKSNLFVIGDFEISVPKMLMIFAFIFSQLGCTWPNRKTTENQNQITQELPPKKDSTLDALVQNRIEYLASVIKTDSIKWQNGPKMFDWEHPMVPKDSTCGYPRLGKLYVDYYRNSVEWRAAELRYYESGRVIPMISADRGFELIKPGCESLVITYDFVKGVYKCILYSEKPKFEPAMNMLSSFRFTLLQADSVLASWGLTRQWPIEEWEEEYRNGQK